MYPRYPRIKHSAKYQVWYSEQDGLTQPSKSLPSNAESRQPTASWTDAKHEQRKAHSFLKTGGWETSISSTPQDDSLRRER